MDLLFLFAVRKVFKRLVFDFCLLFFFSFVHADGFFDSLCRFFASTHSFMFYLSILFFLFCLVLIVYLFLTWRYWFVSLFTLLQVALTFEAIDSPSLEWGSRLRNQGGCEDMSCWWYWHAPSIVGDGWFLHDRLIVWEFIGTLVMFR